MSRREQPGCERYLLPCLSCFESFFGFRLVVCLTTESEATLIARRLFAGYIREMETEWRDCRGKAAMELEGGKTSEDIHYLGLQRKRY